MKDAIAQQGSLHGYRPYKDGGGTVTLMLDDLQWHEFIASQPDLHAMYALVRMNVEAESPSEGS